MAAFGVNAYIFLLVAQYVYATAMSDAIQHDIYSRGSYLVVDGVEGTPLIDDGTHNGFVQEISLNGLETETIYRPVRPIPESEQWFERVYNS